MGIPSKAKYPKAAAKFIEWMLSSKNQADFAGASGPDKVMASRGIPSRQSSLDKVKDTISGGDQISAMLKTSVPVFPGGAPVWYPEFSRAVYTNLHSAATGSMTADQAVDAIVAKAKELAKG
jgi:multiple sugar transport system substrate-binding protein